MYLRHSNFRSLIRLGYPARRAQGFGTICRKTTEEVGNLYDTEAYLRVIEIRSAG
jgi:hypothetical protein